MTSDEELMRRAEKMAENKASFYVHLSAYILVNTLFIFIWWYNGGSDGIFPWFIFITLGWGIGITAHFVEAFVSPNLRDKMVEKEFNKLKAKNK